MIGTNSTVKATASPRLATLVQTAVDMIEPRLKSAKLFRKRWLILLFDNRDPRKEREK
jgi:hypothetical protein